MFLIFWLLQLQFVISLFLFLWAIQNNEKSKQKGFEKRNNADGLYFEEISGHLSKITVTTVHFVNEYVYHLGR